MKPLTRVTLPALLFLFASTAAFADVIGSLDLLPDNPGLTDQFYLTNTTSSPALTFQDLVLTINPGPSQIVIDLASLASLGTDITQDLTYNTIAAFTLTGEVFNGAQLVGYIDLVYGGPTLNTLTCSGEDCQFDVDLIAVPEPATLTLYGSGLFIVAWLRRRRSLKA